MKKLSIVMLSLMTLPAYAYADDQLSALNKYKTSARSEGKKPSSNSASEAEVKPSSETISSTTIKCEDEADQTQSSLPLAYLISLVKDKDELDILHNPRTGSLTVSADDMIGNCSSMLDWKLKQPEISGRKSYAIEAKIKAGSNCSDMGCPYKVAIVEDGSFKRYDTLVFKPTFEGFKECMKQSGVFDSKTGEVVPGAIYSTPLKEKFTGLEETGPLLFLSRGPSSKMIKAKYGQFEHINGCDHYEAAHPQIRGLMTYEDSERERLDAEAAKLKDCKVDEYSKIADFIEKNENYLAQLGDIRDKLILEAAKKSAEAIASGKYTEDDIKFIADF